MKRFISGIFLCATSPRRFARERIKLPLAKFVYDTVDLYKSRTKTGVNNLREILFRGSIVALLTALVVWLSIFMYVAFYYVYVPTITHEKPVYLTFRPCDKWDVHRSICSFPSGSVHFNHKQQSLMVGQPYKVFLELEMPESPTNKDLGMFMVCADFRGTDGRLITNSCRSAMLPYRSTLLDTLFKIFLSPFYMVSHLEEKQKVYIELFSSYLEPEVSFAPDLPGQKVSDIHIEIQTRHIEIYSAKFTISANFSGLRYVMFHWPILSAAIGITSNLFFIAIVSMISWYQIINSEEYLDYLKVERNETEEESRRKYILNQDTSSSEEDVSLIGAEELEGVRKRKTSTSEC